MYIVEEYLKTGRATGESSIERISRKYGAQAVVISIDPRRAYVRTPEEAPPGVKVLETGLPGPHGERLVWFECTVKGGREGRPVDAVSLAKAVEELGAGEILLNSIDRDGTKSGFDIELIEAVRSAVFIPVIASSGAGAPEHFLQVFEKTGVEAALAAGIFHRREVGIGELKGFLKEKGIEVRPV